MGSGKLGVIFDMDGVLVDSAPAHYEAFRLFGERHGIPFSPELFRRIFGLHNNQIFPLWLGRGLSPHELQAYADEKEALYREIASDFLKSVPGARELVHDLTMEGFHLAIGSSGPKANVELALRTLGLSDCFSAISTGDDVQHGKPAPDVFLNAAAKLGIPPASCAVIEDAQAGVDAARAAGAHVVALTTTVPAGEMKNADLVVNTPLDLSPARLRQVILGAQCS